MTRLITISVMGKPQRVLFSGTDEEYRKFQARRRSGKIHKRRATCLFLTAPPAPAVWWN